MALWIWNAKSVSYREETNWVYSLPNGSRCWNKLGHFASCNDNDSQDRPIMIVHKHGIQSVEHPNVYVV